MERTWALLLSLPISTCCRFSLACILCCSFFLPPPFVSVDCQGLIVPIIDSFNCHYILFVYFKAARDRQCWCFNRQSAFPSSFSHYHKSSCSLQQVYEPHGAIKKINTVERTFWRCEMDFQRRGKWGFCPNLFGHLWKSVSSLCYNFLLSTLEKRELC